MGNNSNLFNRIREIFSGASHTKKQLAGLDIDPCSLLAVEMSGHPKSPKIKGIAAAPIAMNTIVEDQIENPITFKESILELKQQFPGLTSNAAITTPGRFMITKQVNLPSSITDNQLNRLAWQQAGKAFPGLVDDLYLDYVKLAGADNKSDSLLIIAARKKELDERMNAIQSGGINTKVIDVDCYVLERAYPLIAPQLPENHEDEYVGIINIDTHRIILSILHHKEIIYFNQVNYNGADLAPIVQTLLGLNNSAENPTNSLTPEQETTIISNIQQLLQFFISESHQAKLTHFVFSGRCALIPNLDKLVQEKLGINTILADPFANTKFITSVDSEKMASKVAAYLLACGLAMRGIEK